jgi:hypothetical protein
MLLVYVFIALLLPILRTLRRAPSVYHRIFCKVFSIKKLYDIIYYNLFWNSTLKYIIEGYLALTLESLTLMKNGLNWSTNLNIEEAVFAIVTMIVCGVAPVAMTVYFIINFTQFRNQTFLKKFSSVIEDFNYRYKWSCMFIPLFCYRRLVMSLLIVFMPRYEYAQVQLITLSCVFVVIFYGYSNVYQT